MVFRVPVLLWPLIDVLIVILAWGLVFNSALHHFGDRHLFVGQRLEIGVLVGMGMSLSLGHSRALGLLF